MVTGMEAPVEELVTARPARVLRPFVAQYSGYRERGVAPAVHRGLPSPYLTVILSLDEPLTMRAHPDPAQPGGDYETLVGGLHTRPAIITHQGRQSGVQLALHPLGARALFGVPAGDLAGLDVPGDAVDARFVADLHEGIRRGATWAERFATLNRLLTARVAELTSSRLIVVPEVSRAWALLGATGGAISVDALAREVGWSARHLRTRLEAETGLTPKAAARVMRFDRTRRQLPRALERGLSIADVAAGCGYFDQAHLAREFRALAGCSPGDWVREEFRNVQVAHALAEEAGAHE